MITTLKDGEGRIIAYLECWSVGESGQKMCHAKYGWTDDIWIHEDYRGLKTLRKLIRKTIERLPKLEKAYWRRHKYNGRTSKLHKRESLLRMEK